MSGRQRRFLVATLTAIAAVGAGVSGLSLSLGAQLVAIVIAAVGSSLAAGLAYQFDVPASKKGAPLRQRGREVPTGL